MPWRGRSIARRRKCSSLESSVIWQERSKIAHADTEEYRSTFPGFSLLCVCEEMLFEQGIDECPWIERQQVAYFLAYADESHGQTKFTRNGDHDSTFCRAVQLGEHDAGNAG